MEFNPHETNERQQDFFEQATADTAPSSTVANEEGQQVSSKEVEKKPTFEDALLRLEQTVARLESTDISLDESLRLFQEGTRLTRICSELLESIEHRITQLVGDGETGVREIPFDEG